MKKDEISDFSISLQDWYEKNRRILPWREDTTSYHVWLSEIMLQQTRVEVVKEYYRRFLEMFPNLLSLANADIDTVNKLWEGLGYYSRARNLLKAATIVKEKYDGIIPNQKDDLLKLPGIGEYTSNAIMAIAYHKPYVAIDGNLIRVFARLCECPIKDKDPKMKEAASYFYTNRLTIDPSVFNQALMDLGELVCLPHGAPRCSICPFSSVCKAHKNKRELAYPIIEKKAKKRKIELTLFIIRHEDSILIRKRNDRGLLASLYEIPNVEGLLSLKEAEQYLIDRGFALFSIASLPEKKHVFTHLAWNMNAYLVRVNGYPNGSLFVNEEELNRSYSLPSAFQHYADYFFKAH